MVFFMATWEEYYTGTLALPVINGPNEGLLIMYSIYFGTAIVGPAIWTQPNIIFPQLNNNHVFVLVTIISGLGQCFFSGTCLIFLYVWHDVFEKSNLLWYFTVLLSGGRDPIYGKQGEGWRSGSVWHHSFHCARHPVCALGSLVAVGCVYGPPTSPYLDCGARIREGMVFSAGLFHCRHSF